MEIAAKPNGNRQEIIFKKRALPVILHKVEQQAAATHKSSPAQFNWCFYWYRNWRMCIILAEHVHKPVKLAILYI